MQGTQDAASCGVFERHPNPGSQCAGQRSGQGGTSTLAIVGDFGDQPFLLVQ